jgi:hypothetical protein
MYRTNAISNYTRDISNYTRDFYNNPDSYGTPINTNTEGYQ